MVNEKETIDLFRGWPNPSLLPTSALSDASAAVIASPAIHTPALLYGPDEGYGPLREHIAQWLASYYQPDEPITASRICVTGGASQNLACILQVFTDPIYTQNVWMVAPTYHLACRIFDDAGFAGRLRAVPQDWTGLDLEYLRRELIAAEESAGEEEIQPLKPPRPWGRLYKYVLYATPTFSNPSTLTMSQADRENLVRLAREYDILVITDDVYDFLQWPSDPKIPLSQHADALLPRLVDVDRYLDGGPSEWGNVVSNGSFSKLIGPRIRTGWAEGTEKLAYGISQTGCQRSGGAPSQFSAAIVDQLFPSGFLRTHIDQVLRPAYASRYYHMMSAIQDHLLPLGVTLPFAGAPVAGGYFIWIALPGSLRASDLAQAALQQYRVKVAEGDIFRVQRDPAVRNNDFGSYVRLCFAWEREEDLAEGVRRLGCAIQQVKSKSGTR
ncbi:aminotransferase-like domain-containing protein [Aspergillus lucknowensis]|uniref:Pyridoxal phosphate-dependent transferase n=1 Tax=Aspergillus lucknowensis TaxID=176173 RepID=A0ABR4LGX2_9EURO